MDPSVNRGRLRALNIFNLRKKDPIRGVGKEKEDGR